LVGFQLQPLLPIQIAVAGSRYPFSSEENLNTMTSKSESEICSPWNYPFASTLARISHRPSKTVARVFRSLELAQILICPNSRRLWRVKTSPCFPSLPSGYSNSTMYCWQSLSMNQGTARVPLMRMSCSWI